MSARVNLAPEVYQNSQRNKQRRKMATLAGVIICSVSIGLVVVALVIIGGQKIAIKTLQGDINDKQAEVAKYTELQDAVTAQQHLKSLSDLHQNKIRYSQFFTVLQSIAPQGLAAENVSISQENILEMRGVARSYDLVTKFAKALEVSNTQTDAKEGDSADAAAPKEPFFTNIELTSVERNTQGLVEFKLTTQMSTAVTADTKTGGQTDGN